MWRDQYIYLGDDGTVIVLVVQRRPPDTLELKVWQGDNGRWGANFYEESKIRGALPDVAKVLTAWSERPSAPLRLGITENPPVMALQLRTRAMAATVKSVALAEIGRFVDPEGLSVYSAGRATFHRGQSQAATGWLLVESTLPNRPRRLGVDYGQFAFVVAASARELILAKHSRDRPGFDFAVVHGESTRQTEQVSVVVKNEQLVLSLPALTTTLNIESLDHLASQGRSAEGTAIAYDVVLLSGNQRTGVAFTIGH